MEVWRREKEHGLLWVPILSEGRSNSISRGRGGSLSEGVRDDVEI